MAQYTTLNTREINSILKEYNSTNLLSAKVLSGGSENTNYYVETPTNKYVLTICEQKTPEKARELADLLLHLEKNNFSSSKIIKTQNGDSISLWKGKPLMLKEFLEGDVIEDLTEDLLNKIGTELGRLHQVPAPEYLPDHFSYGQKYFKEMDSYAPDSDFTKWLKDTQIYLSKYLNPDLPKALIHGDIFYNNIIISKDKKQSIIMDFEEACHYYRGFDIGMILIGCCSDGEKINLLKTKHLLVGYQKQISLSAAEKKALQAFTVYAAAATSFWRYRHYHHVQPDPENQDNYLVMKNLAIHVKGIAGEYFNM